MADININDVIDCTVTQIKPFGAIVTTKNNASGLLHISEISEKFISNIENIIKVGDNLKLIVLEIDEKNGFMRLSLKKLPDDEKSRQTRKKGKDELNQQKIDFSGLKKALPEWIQTTEENSND